jgi:hypothetical protein
VAPDEAASATRPAGPAAPSEDGSDRTTVRRIEFVPVPETPAAPPRRPRRPPSIEPAAPVDQDAPVVPPVTAAEQRWSLWGDLEP